MKKNKSFKGTKHDYLFKCLLFCSECGARLIVKTSYYSIKPLTPEDAMLALQEKPTHNFLAFLNVETGKVNVIHRLKDGKNYGLVEPEA